jgi:hypothetical protein
MLKLSLLLACLGMAFVPASGLPRQSRVPREPAGISQLVENRGGLVSCWGVVIRLGNSRFRKVIGHEQIVIRDAKQGRDLRELMTWRVGRNGRRLVIKFKPGVGDFGSGNGVEVQVARSALAGDVESPNERFEWSLSTDVL